MKAQMVSTKPIRINLEASILFNAEIKKKQDTDTIENLFDFFKTKTRTFYMYLNWFNILNGMNLS